MLGLLKVIEWNKALPKKAIRVKFNLNMPAKDKFDTDISRIAIVGGISPSIHQHRCRHESHFCSVFLQQEQAAVTLSGLNLDTVWEGLVQQVGGIIVAEGNTLDEQTNRE